MSTLKTTNIAHPSSASNNIVLDSSARVGIGTTNSVGKLTVATSSADPSTALSAWSDGYFVVTPGGTTTSGGIGLSFNTSTNIGGISCAAPGSAWRDLIYKASAHRFELGGSEAARIDSSGRLLVGTSTSASAGNASVARIQVVGNSTDAAASSVLALNRGEAATSITSGEAIGNITFGDSSGNEFGLIQCVADANAGTNDYPGRLVFATTADGASSATERMRIESNGNIGINNSTGALAKLDIRQTADSIGCFVYKSNTGTVPTLYLRHDGATGATSRNQIEFSTAGGTVTGYIASTGTATSYITSSDYRLKENIVPVADSIARLQQLKPSRFNFKIDPTSTVDGFIAHEVQSVVPEAVTGEKDAVDDEGNPVYQGIDQSKLVPLLTAALQELVAEVESLKAEVAALKAQ